MMTKLALIAAATAATLALAACGQSDDASADAMADTVEMPADDALANAPEPVAVETPAATPSATETPEVQDTTAAAADAAEAAVADVEAAAAAAAAAQ